MFNALSCWHLFFIRLFVNLSLWLKLIMYTEQIVTYSITCFGWRSDYYIMRRYFITLFLYSWQSLLGRRVVIFVSAVHKWTKHMQMQLPASNAIWRTTISEKFVMFCVILWNIRKLSKIGTCLWPVWDGVIYKERVENYSSIGRFFVRFQVKLLFVWQWLFGDNHNLTYLVRGS